jgi:protocatechuate 3,4-dioxygenase beta subunit
VPEQVGVIAGRQFHDLNASGARDPGEPGLMNWTVYLDTNNNGALDPGELTATTDPLGDYLFTSAPAGTYAVRELPQKGWVTSDPAAGYYAVTVGPRGIGGLDFGVYRTATITRRVFNDLLNANGTQDPGEPGLVGRTVFLDLNGNGRPDPGETAMTNANGDYQFVGVRPGSYPLRELFLPAGWEQSRPVGGVYWLTVTSGQSLAHLDFADFQRASISGQVFWDTNANHVKDAGEPGQAGWVVYLDANNNGVRDPGETFTTTDPTGHYSFTDLLPGTYIVREEIPAYSFRRVWTQSLPTAGFYLVNLTGGQSAADRDFGNVALSFGP